MGYKVVCIINCKVPVFHSYYSFCVGVGLVGWEGSLCGLC
jgi:hypothetical protein